jgi:ribosomal protein S5
LNGIGIGNACECGAAQEAAYIAGKAIYDVSQHSGSRLTLASSAEGCSTTVAGCTWAGLNGIGIGNACECGTAQQVAYKAAKAIYDVSHHSDSQLTLESSGESCSTTVAGCTWAGLNGIGIGNACECGVAQEAAYNTAKAVYDATHHSGSRLTLASSAEGCSTTVAGCTWAGLNGISIGNACECGVAQEAAYKAAKAIYDATHHSGSQWTFKSSAILGVPFATEVLV